MTPKSIGIIMDGNRRWAKAKGLPTLEGHRRGYDKLKDVMGWAKTFGIDYVTVFAFSTENWNRTAEEVAYLMDLIRWILTTELQVIKKEGYRVKIAGDIKRFSPELQVLMKKAEEETDKLPGPTIVLAVSYGGRAEILDAVNKAVKLGKEIDEKEFGSLLWTAGVPDPDLIIRTSGEMRLSGFLAWAGVYSELFFTKTLWPDFSEEEFKEIIAEFSGRERRNGK
ncbi:MAG: di-trans,poly-cis-decaprenylcistransferase [Candidatus Taylorbacteria bacterium]|nr:di-trans,poly-cis-decaprenylcistransferase [Candidatus Taylorbacteria bacterium]